MAQKEPVDHVQRKQDHLRIVVDEAVGALGVTTGLERYRLVHRALPELDLAAIDTSDPLPWARRCARLS